MEHELVFNTTVAKYTTLAMELDIARRTGYRAVETVATKIIGFLEAGYSEQALKQIFSGITVKGIGALLNIERQGAGLENMVREAHTLFDIASKVNAEAVCVVTGPLDVDTVKTFQRNQRSWRYQGLLGESEDLQIKKTSQNLQLLSEIAEEYGMQIYFEALSWTPLNTLEKQVRLLEMTDRGNVKMVLDFWHCFTSGDGPEEIAGLDPHWLYGVHVCDSLPFSGGIPDERILRDIPTGKGVINLPEWVDAVKSTGYNGWWCSETFCRKQQMGNSYDVASQLKTQLQGWLL